MNVLKGLLIGSVLVALAFAFGCSKSDQAPTLPAAPVAVAIPNVPAASPVPATSVTTVATPAVTSTVVAVAAKKPTSKHVSTAERNATDKAQVNAIRAQCLRVVVDTKIAGDIERGVIRDFGDLLAYDAENHVCPSYAMYLDAVKAQHAPKATQPTAKR